jgi:RNA polymerase sigma-70 factor (ECF subfamily)
VVGAAGDWKRQAKVSTWLYTIARNLCTDHARRAVHRRASSLDAPAGPSADGSSDESSGPVLGDRREDRTEERRRQMTFNHHDIRQRLVDFLYGELDAGARAAFDAHLKACDACRGAVTRAEQAR